ncbi:MAG: nucleotide sugar dehydrogenase [Parcubacteria group bacterium]|jgi:UDPglucose 6-dehydrogenase
MTPKKITIIGSGFVGKATGKGFRALGHDVVFVDINTVILDALTKEGFDACTMDGACASDRDIYMVTVMTPTIDDHMDYRFIESAIASLGRVIKKSTHHPIIIIRSTVLPGSTEERFVKILEAESGKKVGIDFDVAMNPEFLRQVHAEEDFIHPWIVVLGTSNTETAMTLEELYQPLGAPIVHMTIKEAEMMKYVHNLFNADKIAFFNEMREVGQKIGVDTDKIFQTVVKSAEGSWNHEYGVKNFGPFGGTCLPKDTRAFLTWTQENLHKKLPLLHGVIRTNQYLKDKIYFEES